jgi:hypothetical protein
MRQFRDRLQDILDAIAHIEAEQAKGKAGLDQGGSVDQLRGDLNPNDARANQSGASRDFAPRRPKA